MTQKLKFAHLADLHLGAWREKKLTELNFDTFKFVINQIIEEKCDFVIFCGDIFNTALPSIDIVNDFANQIRKLRINKIPVYVIGGSHDYTDSQKSFIELLDTTGLIKNVAKIKQIDRNKYALQYTKNENLKLNLAGIVGRKNALEKNILKNLEIKGIELPSNYFNLFLFHTTIDDIKPKSMNFKSEIETSILPKGFNYYAGGHIHKNIVSEFGDAKISYSGALFPNNFKEITQEMPSYNMCEFDFETKKIKINKKEINIYQKEYIEINLNNKNPIEAKKIILEELDKINCKDKIILLEISGNIDGKISDIEINKIVEELYQKEAFIVLKNTYKLKSNLIENIELILNESAKEIEEKIINLNLSEEEEKKLGHKILETDFSKIDEEKNAEYEERVLKIFEKIL